MKARLPKIKIEACTMCPFHDGHRDECEFHMWAPLGIADTMYVKECSASEVPKDCPARIYHLVVEYINEVPGLQET